MSFKGLNIKTTSKQPDRSLNGFYGFTVTLNLTGVRVTDYRGLGLSGVKLIAENPITNISFEGTTDSNGSVYMQLDDQTKITLIKNMIVKDVQYNGEVSPTYKIDLPFIE